jgi:hypothetical protein
MRTKLVDILAVTFKTTAATEKIPGTFRILGIMAS